jgi:hypothetical protein
MVGRGLARFGGAGFGMFRQGKDGRGLVWRQLQTAARRAHALPAALKAVLAWGCLVWQGAANWGWVCYGL